MEELTTNNYQRFKEELDSEIKREAEGFVKIGYLLRVARDTDVLKESGYSNVNEFAEKEYSLDASQVSRFISINERFSEGGFSERLETHYEGFGVAKLSLMLQLPDNLNAELTPDFTKSEINVLKDEVKEEAKITDLEVMCEGKADDHVDAAVKEMLRDYKLFKSIRAAGENYRSAEQFVKDVKEILAPSGVSIKTVRVQGVGRVMLKFDESNEVKLIKVRTNETESYTLDFIAVALRVMVKGTYFDLFGEEPVEEPSEEPVATSKNAASEKIAPVQPKKEPRKEPKVTPAKKDPVPKVKPEEVEEVKPEPEKAEEADSYLVKKPSEIIRKDIADSIEYLHEHVEEIKKDFMSYRIEQQLKIMLEKVARLIEAENEEAADVGDD